MSDDIVRGWTSVYPHVRYEEPRAAIDWLTRVFGFRERVRMARPDGGIIISKLETPGHGLVMVAGVSPDFTAWMRERVPDLREPEVRPWPNLSHTTTVVVSDADAHYENAVDAGATILTAPTDQPYGLRTYAALDLEGHQWEFSQILSIVEPEVWGAMRIEADPES
jgi:uncharacterized glyoxalase superfamily protein PhnB